MHHKLVALDRDEGERRATLRRSLADCLSRLANRSVCPGVSLLGAINNAFSTMIALAL